MKKAVSKLLGGLFLSALVAGLGVSISSAHKDVIESFGIGNYSTDASTYYNGITATSGKQLAAQLHDLITSTHRYYSSYDDNGKNGYQKETDKYYENGQPVSGYIYEFYSGVKWPNGWDPDAGKTTGGYNREHCWCQSNSVNASGTQMWGTTGGGGDMHHIRPAESRLNSTRNNHPYGVVPNRNDKKVYAKFGTDVTYALGGYCGSQSEDVFEPLDNKKGDVARIILYTYLHYNTYSNNTLFGSYGTTNGSGSSGYFSSSLLSVTKIMKPSVEADALAMLLEWNNSDPVDDIETRRNEQVAIYQGNRNPFIDNSNYANLIWGSGTTPSTPTVNSVTVSPSTLDLDVNGTTTGNLTATVSVSNGASTTVNWTSSNTNVATVSSTGVVTAVAKGTCTVTATSTYNPNKSASCTVKVADTSGSGEEQEVTGDFTWDLKAASYDSNPTDNLVTWSHDYAIMKHIRTDSKKTSAKNYLGGTQTSTRFYTGNTLSITPAEDYSITSVVFEATTPGYASALSGSTWTNATASVLDKTVTVTPTNGSIVFSALIGGTCGFTSVKVYYSTTIIVYATLTSITLNTSNAQTEFYVDDTFDSSGLVVTAHYDNGTEDIVTPTSVSSPTMSSIGDKDVTVSYTEGGVTKTAAYTISVINKPVTSISAFVDEDKVYHPGDSISIDDIYVENDLDEVVTDFVFEDDGYIFTYDDAPSGGSVGTKTFTGSITWEELSCDVTVKVAREGYQNVSSVSDTLTATWTGATSTTYITWSNKTLSSGAKYAGNSAKTSTGAIQMRSSNSNSGIVITAYSGSLNITSVSVTWDSATDDARVLDIYGKNSAYSSASDLYGNSKGDKLGSIAKASSTRLDITGSYQFIGIRSYSGALYLSQIVITYGQAETASNVANFIMINDTEGQCTTKLSQAITKLNSMSTSEKSTFSSSDDYAIAAARTRLEAWATHEGKTLTFANGVYSLDAIKTSFIANEINDNSSLPILIFCFITLISGASAYCFIKKRYEA